MKHFIIEIQYSVPTEKIDQVLDRHRQFLQIGYDKGLLLCSGPREPRIGGLIVARALSLNEIEDFINQDPFKLENCAQYSIIEFLPVKHQDFMKEWIAGS